MKEALMVLVVCSMLLAISVGATAQNQKKSVRGEEVYAELGKAPDKARSRVNPLENDAEAVAAGRLLFADHCAECHGQAADGGSGSKKGSSLRAAEVQNASPGAILRKGGG